MDDISFYDLLAELRIDQGGWNPKGTKRLIDGKIEKGARIITYTFDAKESFGDCSEFINDVSPLSKEQREAVSHAFSEIEKVSNIKFRLVGHVDSIDKADMRFFQGKILLPNFVLPGGGVTVNEFKIKDIILSNSQESQDYRTGRLGYKTVAHEILHALGISHPGSDGTKPLYDLDKTIMSYNYGNERIFDLRPLDVSALQYLYGNAQEPSRGDAGNKTNTSIIVPSIPTVLPQRHKAAVRMDARPR